MQNNEKHDSKKVDWRKSGRKVIVRTLTGILVFLIAAIITNFEPSGMIKACGGVIDVDFQKMMQPAPVEFADTIDQGVYVKHGDIKNRRSIINWTTDDAVLEQMNLKPDREIFNRTVKVKYRSVLLVKINAGCKYNPGSTHRDNPEQMGMVLTRISIDGREYAKDNAVFAGPLATALPLCSSAGCIKVLEPGDHELIAEGIFAGKVESNYTSVQVSIFRYQDIQYRQYRDSKSSNHRWMTSALDLGLSPSNKKSDKRTRGVKDVKRVTS